MGLDIRLIRLNERKSLFDHQQVLSVALFGGLGEVEGPGENRRAIDHHHFVVGNSMLIINTFAN